MHTVSQVADMTGVTVRTLHHYDQIGLLRPSGRSEAGYRLYGRADLERLQEILVWRGLGFGLEDIRALLDDPEHDRVAALQDQRELLLAEVGRASQMLAAVEAALKVHEEGEEMNDEDLFAGFDPSSYEQEVAERWGDTDASRQAQRRTNEYSPAQWREMKAEAQAIEATFARLRAEGVAPDSEAAMEAAEAHRRHIHRWFYDCSKQMHAGLGDMYVSDPRFTAHYDEPHGEGTAAYIRDAIVANAAR